MSKWLVVVAAVVALGTAACGSDDDDGGGKGRGGLQGEGCQNMTEAEYDACLDAFVECGRTDGGLCKAEVDAYMACSDIECFETRGAAYVECVETRCPEAAPCMECE